MHQSNKGCLLVCQSFFHNDPKNFVDAGGGLLGCRVFYSRFRTPQDGLSLNIVRANVVGTLNLANVCKEQGLLLMNFTTSCIFEYDNEHHLGSGIGFKEEDKPNFIGSFYSKTKAMVEELLREYENVCTLRVRMPISSDLNNPRNFITKINRYSKVVNIPNSMTMLDELLPISIEESVTDVWFHRLSYFYFQPSKKR